MRWLLERAMACAVSAAMSHWLCDYSGRRQAARTMSGGQQMLAPARGLMSRPPLLMLDEPSLGLAPVITEQLFQIIGRIRDNGVTIFIVEQNVQMTLQIADQAYVLDQGRWCCKGRARRSRRSRAFGRLTLGCSR
jgi:branched-chain amino acid transport system ATP-binding protein